jgi:hypothetical protein
MFRSCERHDRGRSQEGRRLGLRWKSRSLHGGTAKQESQCNFHLAVAAPVSIEKSKRCVAPVFPYPEREISLNATGGPRQRTNVVISKISRPWSEISMRQDSSSAPVALRSRWRFSVAMRSFFWSISKKARCGVCVMLCGFPSAQDFNADLRIEIDKRQRLYGMAEVYRPGLVGRTCFQVTTRGFRGLLSHYP